MTVDLRSDTVTRPTSAMKQAMVEAPVGDDVLGDDPTVQRLEAMAAELAGKEAALFTPSGTMANQIAIKLHTQSGDRVLLHEDAHPFHYETGAAAVISGVQLQTLPGAQGRFTPEAVRAAVRPDNVHYAPDALVCLEDTANRGGGAVWPVAQIDAVCEAASELGLATHMDGARVFNAVVASGVPLDRRVAAVDTLSFCLSKGLGAPVGSLLCGPADLIARGRRIRKMLGGGMRQAGVLAGAGVYALEHHVARLADDHARTARLAEGLVALGYTVVPPETNILYVDVPGAQAVQDALAEAGVLTSATGPDRMRLVVHLDVDDAGIDATLAAFAQLS